eukprot:1461895-Amphidinium_carterae.1
MAPAAADGNKNGHPHTNGGAISTSNASTCHNLDGCKPSKSQTMEAYPNNLVQHSKRVSQGAPTASWDSE